MNWKPLLIVISLFLIGCDTFPKREKGKAKDDTVTLIEFVTANCSTPPVETPVQMFHPEVSVLSCEGDENWIAMTSDSYELFSKNLADVLGGLLEKNLIIEYYEQCLEAAKKLAEHLTNQTN